MAVETNKRKRKLKTQSNEVPNKKTKNDKNSDAREDLLEEPLDGQPNEEEITNDSGFEPDEDHINFSKDFKMLNFRSKLRGNDFIKELRHFLHLAAVKPQIIAKYIEKRGKPLEIAEALERVDKTNTFHLSYLCQALHLVVMEILGNQKTHLESAISACRYFLKNNSAVIEVLLKSNNINHRKCALKLLTAIVCTEPQLGRQLLASFDILSNVKAIENFLSHSRYELNEIETVRKCYIHFILAYLVDGNTLLIRNILDKSVLIKALASGLVFDDHMTVCVVISTLKKFVLECPEISKTKKVNVFDENCIKSFARLYDWLGPAALAAKFADRKVDEGNIFKLKKYTDPAEREVVAEAVHEFLLTLLTSRKHGITFDAMSHFQQRHNKLQGKIIGFLDKPWICDRKTDLVLKTLRACPDLARHTVRHFGTFVNPMRTAPQFWVVVCEFITKIINELHPTLLKGALEKITLTDFSHWIKDICLPIEVLTHITGSGALKNVDYKHRLATNRLLLAMFRQYSNYMAAIIDREKQKKNNLRRFKFDLLNHIFVNFPTIENILHTLYMTINTQDQDGVNVLEHLEVTLDLVLTICQQNRSFVKQTATIMDYLKLLRPLYATDEGQGNIQLELKAIKTILFLFPKALEPQEELFGNVMKSFINAFVLGDGEIQREAGDLLRGIFFNTGIFDTAEMEVDFWLEALRFVDSATVDIVAAVFIEVLQVTKSDVEISNESETKSAIEGEQLAKLFSNIEKGLSVQGYVETPILSKLYPLIVKGVTIGEELGLYMEIVKLLMSHYTDSEANTIQTYNKAAKQIPNLIEVHEAVLKGNKKFEEIFQRSKKNFSLTFIDGKDVQLDEKLQNPRLVMIYIQEVMHIVSHLIRTESLTIEQSNSAADFMVNLLKIMQALLSGAEKIAVDTSGDDEKDEVVLNYFEKTMKYVFSTRLGMIQTTNLFKTDKNNLSYINFLQQVTSCGNTLQVKNFSDFTANFRQKIVKSIQIVAIENVQQLKDQTEELQSVISLIETFQLSYENCLEILDIISKLSYKDFVGAIGQKTIFLDILIGILNRISNIGHSIKCVPSVLNIAQIYIDLVSNSEVNANLEHLEDAIHNFLLVCHQYIPQLPSNVFTIIFEHNKLTKSTIRLACLLLERRPSLQTELVKMLPKNISKKELVYPLFNIAISNGIQLDESLLSSLYQEYKNGFMKTIEKPQKAGVIYKENVQASIHLVEKCMPKSECVDFCNKNIKFDSVEEFQVKIIWAIFQKAFDSIEDRENSEVLSKILAQFINLSIQMLLNLLKKDSLDEDKIGLLSFYLFKWIESSSSLHVDFEKIVKSQNWMNFCKAALKSGMYVSEIEENQFEIDRINGGLLKLLAFLIDRMFEDKGEHQEVGGLFEMIFTHSQFYTIFLKIQPTSVKTQVTHLLYVIAKKCPSVLEAKQIPVVLASYQAKLSDCDRYALALLQLYEEADVGLHQYRPFIWGESAIAFYSLREDQLEKVNLEHQETSVAQVMSLVDRQVSDHTLDNFPIWRKLDPSSQLPKVDFPDPDRVHLMSFGSNIIEKGIEQGLNEFDETDLRLCPRQENHYYGCYDPAFIVPLMSMCFAPEIYSQPVRPVQNGLLSIVFAALSSQDKEMRMAAGCVHLRYRTHFENSKFLEKPLWQQAYDNIQSGLDALRSDWLKHKKNSGIPRVPYISGLFLAKTINLTTDPTHTLYKQLTMFLRLKDTFNFLCIPEFNVLFHSPEIEHHTFRQFIVEIIRKGVKSSSDLFLLVTTSTFKALMGFYGSSMSTLDTNLQILSVLSTCVKIPGSSKIMIEHVGIIPWLNGLLTVIEFYHFDIIEGVISIINNLWYAVKANEKNFHNLPHIQSDIHRLVLKLVPNLSGRISLGNFAKLMNILNKTASETDTHRILSEVQLERLIKCAEKLYGDNLFTSIMMIKENGADGAESHDRYCKNLVSIKTEPSTMTALCSLREFVIKWSRTK